MYLVPGLGSCFALCVNGCLFVQDNAKSKIIICVHFMMDMHVPEHLISLPWEFMISPIHYAFIFYRMCQSQDYIYGLMALVCLPGLG